MTHGIIRRALASMLCAVMVITSAATASAEDDMVMLMEEEDISASISEDVIQPEGVKVCASEMPEDSDSLSEPGEDSIECALEESVSENQQENAGEGEPVPEEGSVSGNDIEQTSSYTTVFSGVEPKIQRLDDGSYVAMKGQKVLLGFAASSSDEKVIKTGTGVMGKAKKTGTSLITFEDGTQAQVSVVKPRISMKKLALSVGNSASLSVTAEGAESKGLKVAWMTSNPSVLQVADGKAVAVGKGKATVYAVIGGKALKCSVKVSDAPASTLVLNAFTDGKAVKIPIKEAKNENWRVSDNRIASIAKGTKILGVGIGETSVSGNTHDLYIYSNGTGVGNAQVTLKEGEQALIRTESHIFPIWKSKDPLIASVSEWGYVIGEREGSTTLSTKIGKTKVKIGVTVSGKAEADLEKREPEYPYVRQVIDGVNGNEEVHVHYNDEGDYYLHTGNDFSYSDPGPNPEPVEKAISGVENGFTYDITPEGTAIITEVFPDRIDGTNKAFRDYFSLTGDDAKPRFTETNIGKTGEFYYVENTPSVENLTSQIEKMGWKVAPDINKVRDDTYDWGVDTDITGEGAVKTFRKLYVDPDTGWVFYVTDKGRSYIIAHDDLRPYDNDPESLDESDETRRPGSSEGIPVDEGSDPNLDPDKWHDGGDSKGNENGQQTNGWRRKHTDPATGIVFILNDEKTEAIVVGAKSPAEGEDGNITIPETVHKTALGGTYPVTGIMADAFDNNSPAAEVTVKGNNGNKKGVTLYGDFVKTGIASDGSFVYKRFFHDDDISVIVNRNGSGYYAEVIGASAENDRIMVRKSISVKGKDVASVPVTLIREDAFNGTSGFVPESGENLVTFVPWAQIVVENEAVTKRGAEVRTRSTGGSGDKDYFWEKTSDGTYRQMFIDARENPLKKGGRDTGATGYVFYVTKGADGSLNAVITGYDIDNVSRYKYAPDGSGLIPEWVNMAGTMVKVSKADVGRYSVTFEPNGGICPVNKKEVQFGALYGALPEPVKENHEFRGWWYSDSSSGSPVTEETRVTKDAAHTLYAHWERVREDEVKASFDPNGGTVGEGYKMVRPKEAYGALPEPIYEGYKFDGWFTVKNGGTKVTMSTIVASMQDHTLYAHWTRIIKPKVTFDANGGACDTGEKEVIYGETYDTLPEVTFAGYDFIGWHTAKNGGQKITESTQVTIQENHTLYARWTPVTYIVTFDGKGGTVEGIGYKSVTFNAPYGDLPAASREKHEFKGWFTEEEDGTEVTPETMVTAVSAHSLYAHWEAIPEYTVKLNPAGGTCDRESITVLRNGTYGALPVPTLDGKEFEGWYTGIEGSGEKITESTRVTKNKNHTLYANYTSKLYTVTLNANGGSCGTESIKVGHNCAYGALPDASRTSYRFLGWFTSSSGGTQVTADTVLENAADTVIYAHWSIITCTVNFNVNNSKGSLGSSASYKTVTYEAAYGTLPIPTAPGETFAGWYTAAEYGSLVTEDTIVRRTDTHTLYARWGEAAYTVTFNANGGTCDVSTKEVVYGAKYGELPEPSWPGHLFNGWYSSVNGGNYISESSTFNYTSNITLYAHWGSDCYIITYNGNGGTCDKQYDTISFGGTIRNLPEAKRANYVFEGWFTAATGGSQVVEGNTYNTAGDMTLYAHWTDGIELKLTGNGWTYFSKVRSYKPNGSYVDYYKGERIIVHRGCRFYIYHTDKTRKWGMYDSEAWDGRGVSVDYGAGEAVFFTVPSDASYTACLKNVKSGSDDTMDMFSQRDSTEWAYDLWLTKYDKTLKYVLNYGSYTYSNPWQTKTVYYGDKYGILPTPPARSGYTFTGWYLDSTKEDQKVTSTSVIDSSGDVSLYAHWKQN